MPWARTQQRQQRSASVGITLSRAEIASFCRRRHIRRLALFGSVLRSDFRPESDIDVLVEFDSDHVPGFFGLADMESELSRIFEGRRADISTPGMLSRYFRDEVLAEAEVVFDEA